MPLPPDHWLRTAHSTRPPASSRIPARSPQPAASTPRSSAPSSIEPADRLTRDGHTLLYAGISPSSDRGKSTLRKRLLTHCGRDAYWSTLRRSVGALLLDELALTPTFRYTQPCPVFGDGEARLSAWLNEYARVAWHEHPPRGNPRRS